MNNTRNALPFSRYSLKTTEGGGGGLNYFPIKASVNECLIPSNNHRTLSFHGNGLLANIAISDKANCAVVLFSCKAIQKH